MGTSNKVIEVEYGEGTDLHTRAKALTHVYAEVIPSVLNDSGSEIEVQPEILEDRKEGTMYVKILLKPQD